MPFVTRSRKAVEVEKGPWKTDIQYSVSNDHYTLHVLLHPPMKVQVAFKQKLKRKDGKWSKKPARFHTYKLKVPWSIFMMRLNKAGAITDTFIFFSKEEPSGDKVPVYLPPLPNVYPSGHICNGTIRVNFDDSPEVKIVEAFKAFWRTPFTEETYPEDEDLIPDCFGQEEYAIMYGWLRYVFEYWERHDREHGPPYRDCDEYPWRQFRIRSKDGESYVRHITCLGELVDYALKFNLKDHYIRR